MRHSTIDLSALLVCGKTCLLQKVLESLFTNQESSHLILKVNTLSQRSNIDDRLINLCQFTLVKSVSNLKNTNSVFKLQSNTKNNISLFNQPQSKK